MCNLCWIRNTLPAGNGFQGCTMRFSLSRQTENELQSHSCFSPPLSPLPLPLSPLLSPSFLAPLPLPPPIWLEPEMYTLFHHVKESNFWITLFKLKENLRDELICIVLFTVTTHEPWFFETICSYQFSFSFFFSGSIKNGRIEVRVEKYLATLPTFLLWEISVLVYNFY